MRTILILTLALLFGACGGNDKKESDAPANAADQNQTTSNNPAENMQNTMKQAEEAMKQMHQPVEPVNFRKLQEVLPEKLAGYARTKKGGETAGAMGMKMSRADGTYKDGSGKTFKVEIIDTGGFSMGVIGMATWAGVTIDKEDENGYERTSTLNGYKSYEKFRTAGSNSEVALIVENRFMVNASCRDCTIESLREIMGKLDLSSLKGMK
ncbi:MAG: hypothetical protein KDC65_05850 [Saprospiraceae bacterium]|nr:hypothetical protein [Saprospiraceae bacterium]